MNQIDFSVSKNKSSIHVGTVVGFKFLNVWRSIVDGSYFALTVLEGFCRFHVMKTKSLKFSQALGDTKFGCWKGMDAPKKLMVFVNRHSPGTPFWFPPLQALAIVILPFRRIGAWNDRVFAHQTVAEPMGCHRHRNEHPPRSTRTHLLARPRRLPRRHTAPAPDAASEWSMDRLHNEGDPKLSPCHPVLGQQMHSVRPPLVSLDSDLPFPSAKHFAM